LKATNGTTLFDRVVEATPGGELLAHCLQCGSCGGSCPSGPDMDHTPRGIFALINAGMEDEVLSSNAPWYCVSCYACTARCPQQIPITDIMYTLKEMAIQAGRYDHPLAAKFSETFLGFVENNGRSFEFGLATKYHLFHHPENVVKLGVMGMGMMRRNRIAFRPTKIEHMEQLQAILAEAKSIAAKERRS
jgi:heterodisulfide reductase subunit C